MHWNVDLIITIVHTCRFIAIIFMHMIFQVVEYLDALFLSVSGLCTSGPINSGTDKTCEFFFKTSILSAYCILNGHRTILRMV